VHLVGFTIRIYYDARTYEHHIDFSNFIEFFSFLMEGKNKSVW